MVQHHFKITNLIEKASADFVCRISGDRPCLARVDNHEVILIEKASVDYVCRISGDGPFLARVDNHEIKIELINE